MPVRLSRFYNDQSIGQGFQNIAGAFAPPDATDMLAAAKAQETREKASRLAQFYSIAQNPATSREQLDRLGLANGLLTPNQSYYSVDQSNATSRFNNAADNTRALRQEAMQQSGQTDRAMLAPVGQDQVRFVPGKLASMYGVTEQQYGPASLAQGETVIRPDGSTLAGAPKPLSETELRAQILGGLPAAEQRASALQGVPVENVVGPDGQPRVAFRADAVGQQPAATPIAPQSATNYRTPDGAEGTAVLRNGTLIDSQTGQPVPQGSRQFSTSVQGSKDETGLGTAGTNSVGKRLLDYNLAEDGIDRFGELIRTTPGALGGVGGAVRTLQNIVATGGELGAVLRKYDVDTQKLIAEGRIAPDVQKRFGNFDPNLPAIEATRQRLIALLAAAQSSDGTVSNRDVDRIEAQIGGSGIFNNDQDTLARLSATKDSLRRERSVLERANPQAAQNFPGSPRLVPQTAGSAPTAAAPATSEAPRRRRFNPATGAIE